jgi:hypothetical protein
MEKEGNEIKVGKEQKEWRHRMKDRDRKKMITPLNYNGII